MTDVSIPTPRIRQMLLLHLPEPIYHPGLKYDTLTAYIDSFALHVTRNGSYPAGVMDGGGCTLEYINIIVPFDYTGDDTPTWNDLGGYPGDSFGNGSVLGSVGGFGPSHTGWTVPPSTSGTMGLSYFLAQAPQVDDDVIYGIALFGTAPYLWTGLLTDCSLVASLSTGWTKTQIQSVG